MMSSNFLKQTVAIFKGEYQLPPALADVFGWLHNTHQVNPINVAFETIGSFYSQSIVIVFEAMPVKLWGHTDAITARFFEVIFKEENRATLALHGHILRLKQKKLPEAMFGFESLEQHALQGSVLLLGKGHEVLPTRYPDLLWNVRYAEKRFIIFYFTEQQRIESDGNGTTDKILNELIQLLKPFDSLNLITLDLLINSSSVTVDSKENYDKNFGGADWMYFR